MTQSLPTFSIITCTWNSARYLPQSIESVLSQKYQPAEYIFVDGGSTDNTLELIDSIPREVKVLHDVRGGISRAMNAGLNIASADIVAHLHSDDYYLDANVLLEVGELFSNSDAEWLFGSIVSDIDGHQEPLGYVVPRYSYKRLLRGNFIPHPATFVKRTLFKKVGFFNEAYRFAMDYALWLELGKYAEPIQLDRAFTAFRRHKDSLSTSNPLLGLEEDYRIRMKHAGSLPLGRLMHYLRYLVRRRRLLQRLKQEAGLNQ